MAPTSTDRNLLFGILALQMDFITRDALIEAMNSWILEKHRALGEVLVDRGDLDPLDRAVLDPIVDRHVARHGHDAARSLASLSSVEWLREGLTPIDDAEVQVSVARIGSGPSTEPEHDPSATVSLPDHPTTGGNGARFRVLRPHAKGGLGQVFLARDEELGRTVALKEMQPQHADNLLLRSRFVLEAEINGNLEHPGIVPVYGLGLYADGRPYYAMRFVEGDSLREAIEQFHRGAPSLTESERMLMLRQLLKRFVDVCEAVAYAHSRGVLHRDLKPANVMLGKYGETLIIDWGLAKAVGRGEDARPEVSAGAATLVPPSGSSSDPTLAGQALGTPQYMSPEQARGEIDRLGTATDIYGLGGILYCLLTGRAPVAGETIEEILNKASHGRIDPPRQLRPDVPRPLEAICLKALSRRPEDRYPTARALAEDVERWQADEPVGVYRDPPAERLRRWARRHRTAVASLGVLVATGLVALSVGLAVVAYQRSLTEQARGKAQQNYELAQANFREAEANLKHARDAVDRYFIQVSRARLLNEPGMQPLRRELLQSALEYYRKIADDRGEDPRSRADVGMALGRLAQITAELDGSAKALEINQRALDVLERLDREHPDEPTHRASLAGSLLNQGWMLDNLERPGEAEPEYRRALEVYRAITEADPDDLDAADKRAMTLLHLAWLQSRTGRKPEARATYEESLRLRQELARRFPDNDTVQGHLSDSLHDMALLRRDMGEIEPALEGFEQARAIRETLARKHPDDIELRRKLVYSLGEMAGTLFFFAQRPNEAEPLYREAVEVARRLADENPNVAGERRALAILLNNLASLQGRLGEHETARETADQAIAAWRILVEKQPQVADLRAALGDALAVSAEILATLRLDDEAASRRREAADTFEALAKANPSVPLYAIKRATVELNAAAAAIAADDRDLAHNLLNGAAVALEAVLAGEPQNIVARRTLANVLWGRGDNASHLGRHDAALADLDRAVELADGPDKERLTLGKAQCLARRGDVAAALKTQAGMRRDALATPGLLAPGTVEYDEALLYALCARALASSEPDRAATCAEKAVALLREADARGFFHDRKAVQVALDRGDDLEALRDRDEYRRLRAEIEARIGP
jgi:tetratricopeptide (TPR) repeat protein/tRNA A-37 threonylcarbamoyl transferase component Bud32